MPGLWLPGGRGGWIRTNAYGSQSPVPYRLATSLYILGQTHSSEGSWASQVSKTYLAEREGIAPPLRYRRLRFSKPTHYYSGNAP